MNGIKKNKKKNLPARMSSTRARSAITAALAVTFFTIIAFFTYTQIFKFHKKPITIGLLHPLSDKTGLDRASVRDIQLFAIEEINAAGGVLGHKLEPISVDGGSTEESFAQGARELAVEKKVACIFSSSYSAQRKAARTVVEKENSLLLYCEYYEGLESSPNIFYSGGCGNQTVMPAVAWILHNIGKKIFILGRDSIYSHAAAQLAKDHAHALGHEIVGEAFVDAADSNIESALDALIKSDPDVILNLTANIALFNELKKRKVIKRVPTVGFNIFEVNQAHYHVSSSDIGDYIVASYLQNIHTDSNDEFVKKFHTCFPNHRIITANMVAAYCDIYLWKQAVEKAGTFDPGSVIPHLKKEYFASPLGIVYYGDNHCLAKNIYIGKISSDGQFDILWDSKKTVHAQPYPLYRSKQEWELFLKKLYESWGNRWVRPSSVAMQDEP